MSRPRRHLDWSWGPGHGPVSGVGNAALSACSVTMVSDLLNAADVWPTAPWWTLGLGAGAAALAAGMGAWQYAPTRVVCYRAACWLGAGIWSAWSITGNPWSLPSLATLATGWVTAAAVGVMLSRAEAREKAREQRAAEALLAKQRPARPKPTTEVERIAAEWEQCIARVCGVQVDIRNVELWPGDPCPGYTLDGDLPQGGTTWRRLQAYEDGLAADAKLDEGCGVEVRQGANRGSFLARVEILNHFAEDVDYPCTYPHETINDPRLIATWRDGTEARYPLRQEVVLAVGPTGSGKTTLMNVLIGEHVKCVDVIPCVIDFNGGSLALPWLLAWRQDPKACPRPPISLVADTPQKALVMTEKLLQIAKDRKAGYAHLKMASNSTLLPISADLPQWTVFVDEVAEVLGIDAQSDPIKRQVASNLLELQRIGRDSGVRLVIASLGATNTSLSDRQVKIHARVKIAMAATPTDEQYYLFDVSSLATEDLAHPGCARIKFDVGTPQGAKVPNLLPEQIAEIAIATSDRRPDPDARALEILGDVWTRRWEDSAELLAILDAGAEAIAALERGEPLTAVTGARSAAAPPAPARGEDRTAEAPTLPDAMAGIEAARQRMRDAVEQAGSEPESAADDPDMARTLDEIRALPEVDPQRPWSQPPRPRPRIHPRLHMREMVFEARVSGIGPTEVHRRLKDEGYPTSYQTVNDWMREDARKGIISQPGGDRTPYFPPPARPGV